MHREAIDDDRLSDAGRRAESRPRIGIVLEAEPWATGIAEPTGETIGGRRVGFEAWVRVVVAIGMPECFAGQGHGSGEPGGSDPFS